MTQVLVPPPRWERWVDNFRDRHGETVLDVADGALHGTAADGSTFVARLPFDQTYDGPPDPTTMATLARPLGSWGVLLVRKGGFAIARMAGAEIAESKVGQRHVQGRTKAGGQSQQRFARRREKQAREAFEAAAGHAARILGGAVRVEETVTGGDHVAVEEVLTDPRLVSIRTVGPWLAVPDPRRAVLEQAVRDAQALVVSVDNA